jgi:hypothetical protein
MELSLPPELKRFVEKKVKEGLYEDENAVVCEALRVLRERERWVARSVPGPGPGLEEFIISAPSLEYFIGHAGTLLLADVQQDLKDMAARLKALLAAKQALREIITRINQDISANLAQRNKESPLDFACGLGSERAYHRVKMPVADPESPGGVKYILTDLHPGRITDIAELRAVQADLRDQLDSLSEMGEMDSLRLQMLMDRRSKLMETLSNMLKKSSDTASSIVQNLK